MEKGTPLKSRGSAEPDRQRWCGPRLMCSVITFGCWRSLDLRQRCCCGWSGRAQDRAARTAPQGAPPDAQRSWRLDWLLSRGCGCTALLLLTVRIQARQGSPTAETQAVDPQNGCSFTNACKPAGRSLEQLFRHEIVFGKPVACQ